MSNLDRANGLAAPPINPTSGGGMLSGMGDETFINVRKQADGVVLEASTLNEAQISGGGIFIGNCNTIAIYVEKVEFGTGPLTQVLIKPQFAITKGGTKYAPRIYDISGLDYDSQWAGIEINTEFITAPGALVQIGNPGANWMYIYTEATGTVTGSYAIIDVARGWGEPVWNWTKP